MLSFNTLLTTAYNEAMKSSYKQRIGSVIFNKNIIISTGYNKTKSWKKHLHPKFKKWPTSIHSEAAAILNAKTNLKNFDILVCRLAANNDLTLAKPCPYCMDYLTYVGIKRIYYTISEIPFESVTLGILYRGTFDTLIYKY